MVSAYLQLKVAKALTEFLGTMFLCLTVALAARDGISEIAPVAIGCVLMVCIYAGGHVSGAHYNPAVTLAVLVRGGNKLSLADGALYVTSQLAGALCATLLSWALVGRDEAAYPASSDVHVLSLLLCEAMVSFALCSVVLHTATTNAQDGNSHFGLAIGFTVLSGAVSVGGISGGAFNPAVGSMSLFYGEDAAKDAWIYWVGPLIGGAVAGVVFRIVAWQEYSQVASETQRILAPCIVELIGTMMLSFTVGVAAGAILAPLAIGSMLMAMIYMGGWISGGHFNPAVTLAVLARSLLGASCGRSIFAWREAVRYVLAQLAGAALGSLAASGAFGGRQPLFPAVPQDTSVGQAILGEFLGTFLLAYTVLNVATVEQVANNSYFGLAIGMVVTAMACGLGPVGGGAFNPAVGSMGFVVAGQTDLWVYWSACPLGGLLAACFFRIQNAQEFQASVKPSEVDAQPAPHEHMEARQDAVEPPSGGEEGGDAHAVKESPARRELGQWEPEDIPQEQYLRVEV